MNAKASTARALGSSPSSARSPAISSQSASPRRRRRAGRSNWIPAIVLLSPAIVALLLLRIVPAIEAFRLSLTDAGGDVTLGHFTRIFADPSFINSLKVTLVFSLVVNPLQIALALLLAVLLTRAIPLVGLWRTLILLPIAIPQAVSAVIWYVLFRPDGPLNGILEIFGIPAIPWLISADMALYSVIIVVSWVGVGYWMTFLVAGINEIPGSLYEAAELDGAGPVRTFWNITVPGLRRQILFVLVADTVSNFLIFAPVRILTGGGPSGSTDLIMHNIFERAYTLGDMGSASAATVVLVAIVVLVVAVQFYLMPGKEES